jgi:preprotein translocase subunit SecE
MQTTELRYDQEQEERSRSSRNEQVLQILRETHRSQGNEIAEEREMADKNNDKDKAKDLKKKSVLATAANRAKSSNRGERTGFREYFRGVKVEVKKVVWPTRKELVLYTWTVLITCVAFSLAIWAVDTLFLQVLRLTLGFSF